MLQNTYHNPLLPGFYPDPSICRVGYGYFFIRLLSGTADFPQ